jgi:hypothetical protein
VTIDPLTSGYDRLPTEPGVYRVETVSGTVHIIDLRGRATWERRPTPGSMKAAYDGRTVVLSQLDQGWEVGGQGYLEVSDETYLTGKTWHVTSTITSITDELLPSSGPGSTY